METHDGSTPFNVTIDFTTPVTGFRQSDLWMRRVTVNSFSGSDGDQVYELQVTPQGGQRVVIHVPSFTATTVAGGFGNHSSRRLIVEYDPPGVTISPRPLTVPEGGSATYSVVLEAQPRSDVTVDLGAGRADDDISVSGSSSVTFTRNNWNSPRTIEIAAAEDNDCSRGFRQFRPSVTSADPAYDDFSVRGLTAYEGDNDTDCTGPTVASIKREPEAMTNSRFQYTNNDALVFRVKFSEPVQSVDVRDFDASGTTGDASNVQAVAGNAAQYLVTVSDGNLQGLDGEVGLIFATGKDIADSAGNTLTATLPSGTDYETYTVDNTAPSVALARADSATDALNGEFDVTVTFTEANGLRLRGPDSFRYPLDRHYHQDTDVVVTNGTFAALQPPGPHLEPAPLVYTATIRPDSGVLGAVLVDVPAGAVMDFAGNSNTAAMQLSVPVDNTPPAPMLSATLLAQEGGSVWVVTVDFGEAVTGFTSADIDVSGGSASSFTGSDGDSSYTVRVTPDGNADVVVSVEAGVAEDLAGNTNLAADDLTIQAVDSTSPTVVSVERSSPTTVVTNVDTLSFRVTFSEDVENVNAADFAVSATTATVSGATVVAGNDGQYIVTVGGGTLTGYDGTVGLAFASDQNIQDLAGNALDATLPAGINYETYTLDNTRPTVALMGPGTHDGSAFDVTVAFSKDVTGFADAADVSVTGGSLNGGATGITRNSGASYTASITPSGVADVTVTVVADAAEDASGNGNAASAPQTITYGGSVTLTVGSSLGAYEGATLNFPVTVDNAVPGGFTVTVSFISLGRGSVRYPDQTLTFQGLAGERHTASVVTTDDELPQSGIRTVTARVEASLDFIDDSDTGTARIRDNDSGILSMENASAAEGENLSFTISLNNFVKGGFDVTLSYQGGPPAHRAATSGDDYTPNTDTIAFEGTIGEQHTFTVEALHDGTEETNEKFTVTAASATRPPFIQSASATGTITDATVELTFDGEVADQAYTIDTAITDLTLPQAQGAMGTVTYTLDGRPPGLAFDPDTRVMSGTPTSIRQGGWYPTYKAVDGDTGWQGSVRFQVTVNPEPTVRRPANQAYERHVPIEPFELPEATGGTGDYTYALEGDLPAGLVFDAEARPPTITGTPTQATVGLGAALVYRVTDALGATNTGVTFFITVAPSLAPLDKPDDLVFTQDSRISPVTLPRASGDGAPFTYALSPDPPAGITFTSSTQGLSGTPTAATNGAVEYTYTATSRDNRKRSATFTITVNPKLVLDAVADQILDPDTAFSLALPQASGGTAPLRYELEGALPDGLSFNAATQVISGTPTAVTPARTLSYAVIDHVGARLTRPFTITVQNDLAVTAPQDQAYTEDQRIDDLELDAATGGDENYVDYAITPALPAGLSFDKNALEVRGTPEDASARTQYTYTVTDGSGAKASDTFHITVNEAPALSAPPEQPYTEGRAITALTLDTATGGTPPFTYDLSDDLPAGLAFDPATRVLSGTPTTARSDRVTVTYTATDTNGAQAMDDFVVRVYPKPSLNPELDRTYTVNLAITPVTLGRASGGAAPLTYALEDLPAGLAFDPAARVMSGTPTTAATDPQAVTYGVDWATERWTAGLSFGHSAGAGGYRRGDCAADTGSCGGTIAATLAGLYPYAGFTLGKRLSLWLAAGLGAGQLTVHPHGSGALSTGLGLGMGALGLRSQETGAPGGAVRLTLKGDARFTHTWSEAASGAHGNLAPAGAGVWLVRAGIEGSRRFALGPKASLTPSLEIGIRRDGGDAETGFGADVGAGLALEDLRHGLRLELRLRALAAHESADFRDWGASAALSFDPRPASNRGLSMSLRQAWGVSPSGGMEGRRCCGVRACPARRLPALAAPPRAAWRASWATAYRYSAAP